jgi:hypothetical protein
MSGIDATLSGLMEYGLGLPRVARSSPPWAESFNPVGIGLFFLEGDFTCPVRSLQTWAESFNPFAIGKRDDMDRSCHGNGIIFP